MRSAGAGPSRTACTGSPDVTFAEDHSQIRTGHGPQAMATLRYLAVSLHRLGAATNIAAPAAKSADTQRASCR